MRKTIIENLFLPAVHRIGTVAATWLLSVGIPQDHVSAITGGLTAVMLVAIEFGIRNWGVK